MVASMRLLLAALLGFALAVVPALAADHAVTASGVSWNPATIEVKVGDRVVWSNPEGGFHNVKFDDGGLDKPADPAAIWTEEVARTFTEAGSYRYVCEAHEADGMIGTVVVRADDGTTTTTTQTITTTPPPPTTPTSTTVVKPAVTVRTVGTRFRSRTGIRLRVTSDRARTLTGTFRRRGRTVGTLRLRVRKGSRIYRVRRTRAGRRLRPGSYRLVVRSAGAYGLPVTVKFRVR